MLTLPSLSQLTNTPKVMRLTLIGALAICAVVNLVRYSPNDYEVECTKHYYSDNHFYGGYSCSYVKTKDGCVPNQCEAHHLWRNLSALLDDGLDPHQSVTFHHAHDGLSRLLAGSGLPALFTRLTLGQFTYGTAYFVTNLFLWGMAIICMYRLAEIYFPDTSASLIAAIFTACYPVFPLMLRSVKVQYAGVPYLLFGLFAYETRLREAASWRQLLFFLTYGVLGMLSAMGTVYLFLVLLGLALPRAWQQSRRWAFAVCLAGLAGGALAAGPIFRLQGLDASSTFQEHHVGDIVRDSFTYLWTALQGGDTSTLKFLNCPGNEFVSVFLKRQLSGLFDQNRAVCCLAIVAMLVLPSARKFGIAAVLLFVPAEAPTILTTWFYYHYAYCTAPVMMMLFLATAGLLGQLLTQEHRSYRLAGMALLALTLASFCWNQKRALCNYYGHLDAWPDVRRTTFVYHGADCSRY